VENRQLSLVCLSHWLLFHRVNACLLTSPHVADARAPFLYRSMVLFSSSSEVELDFFFRSSDHEKIRVLWLFLNLNLSSLFLKGPNLFFLVLHQPQHELGLSALALALAGFFCVAFTVIC
jgi:hypothetical protein